LPVVGGRVRVAVVNKTYTVS